MSDLKVNDRRWWARGEQAPADGDQEARLKPTYVEELEQKIAVKDQEIQQLLTTYRSASDEFDQARARLRKEVSKDIERGRRAMLGAFLDVLDNLDRALAAGGDRSADPVIHGVSLVQQQFVSVLEGLGITRVDPTGAPFDPTLHEAVATAPATAATPHGHIIGVVKPGYLIGTEVLRPAMVAVAE